MDRRRALELAEGSRDELLGLLKALIGVPSPNCESARRAQELLGDYLERAGFTVETTKESWKSGRDHPEFSTPTSWDEAPVNLVATPPEPLGLTLFAHVDTESPSRPWTVTGPCLPLERDGRIYGLGAADDKGGLAAAAVAAALLARQGRGAPRVASVHGKGGGARGTLPVFRRLRKPGECLYVHPPENGAGLGVLKSASRGVVDVMIRVTGWRGRPREIGTPESIPFEEGGNALEACLRLVERLRRKELADCELNLGRVAAGEAPGVTPLRCDAELRVLFRGTGTVDEVLAAVRRAAEDQAGLRTDADEAFRFEVTAPGLRANPADTPWDGPFAAALRTAVGEITGREPIPYADHLASDIRFPIRLRGVDSLGIGSLGGNFYGPDEWVDLDDLVRLVAVLVLFGWRWTGSASQQPVVEPG